MNDTVFEIDFTRALPPTLKNDEDMLALAKVVAGELQITAKLSRLNLIYARIDELEESLLDILAYDFHVDWYSYDYPIEAKRAVIKDSVRVHKRLGTVYAVKTALGSVYPESEVEEWFDYNGEPFSFRVVLDVTNSKAPAEYFAIKKAVDSYKRLTAHMDDLIYQCRAVVEIRVETEIFYLSATMTGKHRSGTYPQRNMKGGLAGASVNVTPQGGGFLFASTRTGTEPQRNTVAVLREEVIQPEGSGTAFRFTAGAAGQYEAGTEPYRNTVGGFSAAGVEEHTEGRGYAFTSPPAGAEPQRNTVAVLREEVIQPEGGGTAFRFTAGATGQYEAGTEPYRNAVGGFSAVEVKEHTEGRGYAFTSPPAGAEPQRTTGAGVTAAEVEAETEGRGYNFISPQAGTEPHRETLADYDNGGIVPTVTAEGFSFRVKRCGTTRCKNKNKDKGV